ncbi:acyl-CoA synthase [Brenneria roseae subsp. roseae]|uniref:AMP-binding protein n=1 Tax=Brenneria roseae TaxID=1509241 RepID=UPI000D6178BC|nr:AMP-binding protein [Brenneria roseae]PWC17945.1 acyl-CoA synthase [Brenneria roseae subsp. roseae]
MGLLTITAGECLNKAAMLNPSGIALIESRTGKSLTWQELNDDVNRVARGLLVRGMKKGDRLGIWSANNVEWIICFLAAARIGVVVVGINFHFMKKELYDLLHLTRIKALCLSDGFRENDFSEVIASLSQQSEAEEAFFPELLISIGNKKASQAWSLNEIKEQGRSLPISHYEEAVSQVQSNDLLTIQLTSGSTALPKCVMLSHHSVVNNAFFSAQRLNVVPDDILCLAVPLFHCFGLSSGLFFSLHTGCKMVLLDNYRADEVLKSVQTYRCSVMHGVPTIFSRLMQNDDLVHYDTTSLDKGIVAGAYCPPRLIQDIVMRLGMKHISVSYGQTETSPCCTQTLPDDSISLKSHSIGKPLPFIEMKIADLKTGNPCPAGVRGEICTRGFHVMMGYYHDDEQTRKTIDPQGWLHTGDIGFIDVNGDYHYSHRIKDIIVRGGENISSREVEEAILEYPGIDLVKVFGVESEELGEEVAAAICMKEGYLSCETELREFLRHRLAHYKTPANIHFLKKFPYTPCGKIDIQKLKSLTSNKNTVNKYKENAVASHRK